jgi:hypothetical protein
MECHLVVNRDKSVFILHTYDGSHVWEVDVVEAAVSKILTVLGKGKQKKYPNP